MPNLAELARWRAPNVATDPQQMYAPQQQQMYAPQPYGDASMQGAYQPMPMQDAAPSSMPTQEAAYQKPITGIWGASQPMEQTMFGNNVPQQNVQNGVFDRQYAQPQQNTNTDAQSAAFNMQNGPPQPPQGPMQPGPMDNGWQQQGEQHSQTNKPWWMTANY